MLALVAENERLKQQIAKLILDNEDLVRKVPVKNNLPSESFKMSFGVSMLQNNKKKDEFIYYTGLTNEQFTTFYDFLVPPRVQELPFDVLKKISVQKKMTMIDQLLMVMVKLRQNFDFVHIGKLFSISQQDASGIFKSWIEYMFFRCSSVSIWPHRDTIIEMMPENFKKEFPTTLVIIDGTEIKIQRQAQ